MSANILRRVGAGVGTLAAIATIWATTAPTASAAEAFSAAPAATRAATVTPTDQVCGFNGGLFGQAVYDNCSPYSVEIRIEWWFSDDTYLCVPANLSEPLNNPQTQTPPYYAVFDGRTNC